MAAYFQLTRIGSREPATFASIDAAICQNLNLPFDENEYTHQWYDTFGFRLAIGHSFSKIVDEFHEHMIKDAAHPEFMPFYHTTLRICHFLNEHYTTDSWIGR